MTTVSMSVSNNVVGKRSQRYEFNQYILVICLIIGRNSLRGQRETVNHAGDIRKFSILLAVQTFFV